MSSRMLKRHLEQKLKAEQKDDKEKSDVESEEEEDEASTAPAINPFDLLGDDDERAQSEVEEEDPEPPPDCKESTPATEELGGGGSKSAKKKKKKNKGGNKSKGKHKAVGDESAAVDSTTKPGQKEEDIDSILRELNIRPRGQEPEITERDFDGGQTVSSAAKRARVLGVDPRHLKAEDELRRIFGSKVMNSVDRSEGGAAARDDIFGRRAIQGSRTGTLGGRGKLMKKHHLVHPLSHWPPWQGGTSMESVETKDGFQYFRYTRSSSDAYLQKKYEECVASHDPNTLGHLLSRHPYHANSLLSLSEVYKSMGEFQTSADLLERCLFSLEASWHPHFNPALGTCRLEYAVEENQALFHALFRHVQHLGRRGCHRTALEVCKLLLSLDPSDPLGAKFFIDSYALRAGQYEWLEQFLEESTPDSSLALLPNFAFSSAIARFYLERTASEEGRKGRVLDPTHAAGMQRESSGDGEVMASSRELVEQALMLHPLLLKQIVERAAMKVDAPWAKVLKHSLFAFPASGGPSLEHLMELYLERNASVWRAPELQVWVREGATAVIAKAEDRKGAGAGEVDSWAAVRKEAFAATENEYRHLLKADFSDSISVLPPEEVQALREAAGNGMGGMPRAEMMMGPPNGVPAGPPAGAPPPVALDPEGRNALMVFLEALLPWNDFGVDMHGGEAGPAQEAGDGDVDGRPGEGGDRR